MRNLPLYRSDPSLDELNLDEALLTRAREAHALDHADDVADLATADETPASAIAPTGFDPAEYPMSVLEQMQRDQDAEDAKYVGDAERVIAAVGRITKFGMSVATGSRVHHRREH